MSRTYKDRPYRVKVNEDGVHREAVHRHDEFGMKVYKNVTVRDKKGNPVWEEAPIYQTVKFARVPRILYKSYKTPMFGVTSSLLYINGFMDYKVPYINPLWLEREKLIREGREFDKMFVGTQKQIKRIRVLDFVVKDYCTVNEPWDGSWHGEQPCYRELPPGYGLPQYRSKWDQSGQREVKRRNRNRKLRSSQRLVKAYNSGEDLDTFEKDLVNISQVDRVSGW